MPNPINPTYYSRWKIEPWDFIKANDLDFFRGNIIKYIMRSDAKNGVEDLKKARAYLDKLIGSEGSARRLSCVLEVSTANITSEDAEVLTRASWDKKGMGSSNIIAHPNGWFVNIKEKLAPELLQRLSPQFSEIYEEALSKNVSWINFDKYAYSLKVCQKEK